MAGLKRVVVCSLVLAACQSQEVHQAGGGSPGRRIEDFERVFAPMLERASVAANRLSIDVSRELWDRFGYPSRSNVHDFSFDPGPPSVYRFRNSKGGLSLPLKFVIGRQTFLIVGSAEIRVHRAGPARLDIEAQGDVVVHRALGDPETVASLRVQDGKWEAGRVR